MGRREYLKLDEDVAADDDVGHGHGPDCQYKVEPLYKTATQ